MLRTVSSRVDSAMLLAPAWLIGQVALMSCAAIETEPTSIEHSLESWIESECAGRGLDLPPEMSGSLPLAAGGVKGALFIDRSGNATLLRRRFAADGDGFPEPPREGWDFLIPEPPPPPCEEDEATFELIFPPWPLSVRLDAEGQLQIFEEGEAVPGFGAFVDRLQAASRQPRSPSWFAPQERDLDVPSAVVLEIAPECSVTDGVAFVQLVDSLAPALFRIYETIDTRPLPELTETLATWPDDIEEPGDLLLVVDGRCSWKGLLRVLTAIGSAGKLHGRIALAVRHRGGGLRKICFYLPYA